MSLDDVVQATIDLGDFLRKHYSEYVERGREGITRSEVRPEGESYFIEFKYNLLGETVYVDYFLKTGNYGDKKLMRISVGKKELQISIDDEEIRVDGDVVRIESTEPEELAKKLEAMFEYGDEKYKG